MTSSIQVVGQVGLTGTGNTTVLSQLQLSGYTPPAGFVLQIIGITLAGWSGNGGDSSYTISLRQNGVSGSYDNLFYFAIAQDMPFAYSSDSSGRRILEGLILYPGDQLWFDETNSNSGAYAVLTVYGILIPATAGSTYVRHDGLTPANGSYTPLLTGFSGAVVPPGKRFQVSVIQVYGAYVNHGGLSIHHTINGALISTSTNIVYMYYSTGSTFPPNSMLHGLVLGAGDGLYATRGDPSDSPMIRVHGVLFTP